MRRVLAGGAAVVTVLAPPPGAHAGSDSMLVGGCSFAGTEYVGDATTGEVDIEALAYSPADPARPVAATVTCHVRVNGVPQPDTYLTAAGTVAVAGARVVTYPAVGPDDWVQLCQRVDYTSPGDTTPVSEECFDSSEIEWPPPVVDTWNMEYHLTCPFLTSLDTDLGRVRIDHEGDVFLDGEAVWDCPPFAGG